MCFGAIGSNEKSHFGNLLEQIGDHPEALLAPDPFSSAVFRNATGDKGFEPLVGQLGGETGTQFKQSQAQGVNTGPSQTLGAIANVIAGAIAGGAVAGGGGGAAADGVDAAETGAAADGSYAGEVGLTSEDVGTGAAAGNGTGGAVGDTATASGSGAAGTSSSGTNWGDLAKTGAKVLAPTVLSSLLAPKPPKTQAVSAMPDPLAQQQAQQQKLIAQMARRGRSSTILTNPSNGGGALGG